MNKKCLRLGAKSQAQLKTYKLLREFSLSRLKSEVLGIHKSGKPFIFNPLLGKSQGSTLKLKSHSLPSRQTQGKGEQNSIKLAKSPKKLEINSVYDLEKSIYSLKDDINYFRFRIRGKEAPMSIEITKLQGDIIIYYSQVNKYPSERNCDRVYRKTSLKIFGSGYKQRFFTEKMAYFGIKSSQLSSYHLSVRFGVKFANASDQLAKSYVKVEDDSLDRKLQQSSRVVKANECKSQRVLKRTPIRHLPLMFSRLS